MEMSIKQSGEKIKNAGSYGMIVIGTFLMALGTNFVYEPMSMVTGGFSGIGIILQKFVSVPLWVVTFGLNIPLFWFAVRRMGGSFIRKTLLAAALFSLMLAILPQPQVKNGDYLMAAVVGGALHGGGLALVFRQSASTGGTDLLATFLKLIFPSTSSGTIVGVLDGIIVVAGMFVFGVRTALYSVVAVYVSARLMDRILDGLRFAKMLFIISDEPETIAAGILQKIRRGVTAIHGTGMYSGEKKQVLMCAVSRKEAVSVVKYVKETDPRSFIIINDAREVLGEGFEGER